uniref:Msx2-interacting protein n=1 Tax=Sparus aurata TaxID=8175 RepID=A0A671YM86_SPAAU
MVRETRHLWVGNLPEHVREEKIVEHFKRYGRVESVKVLRKRGSEGGVAAFVDFVDIKSAQKAHNAVNKMGDRDLRTDYNEPGSVPSAVRGLEDSTPSSSRDVTGFSRGTVGPVFGPPVSLHTREGRYERRIDGSSETRERAYDHSPYGHHERSSTFDRQRHYNADYYRDRSMFAAAGPGSSAIAGSFEASDPHFDSRIRDPFTLTNSTRRDLYRDDRGRRVDRTYHHRRSRSSHSSASRHPSPQRTTGQTPKTPHSPKRAPLSPGRGPRSRSRSRSSSSDSVSSTSSTGSGSDSNSSSSDGSRARSVQSSATHAPNQSSMVLDSDEPRRSFGIKVQNLPVRSTDTSLKDGLFHEFKKHGKVTSVQIHGASEDRYGLVFFRQQEDQEKALTVSKGKLFFGMMIEVTAWNGPETESENEFRPLDGRIDEFHPKATRTLFIGNLEKTTSYQQLLDIFQRFGEIVDIDIKKVNGVPQYAFVQYSDIASVCKAIKKMDGEYLGSNRLKLGFGKSMPTTCVWLDGLATSITEQYLTRHFCRYGHVVKVVFDRLKGMALILYNNTDFAQAAVRETKGWKIGGNKIKVDFASQESQMAFYRSMQTSGQDIRDFYEIPPERREERRPPYHEFTAERAYYENIRTPGLYPEDARRDYAARSRERFPELEHYQGDHFDPRYHEDPRDYRDYRDPFEQDIRKYTYIQRERERERERFEADRSRWSPSHPRRPVTPTVSPSPSERAPRDSERRVYSQSSERSGSVSSMSPPHFDKSEKTLLEHASKSDKSEKSSQPDRVAGAEKTKRAKRKEKGDKDKTEKVKSRKAKGQSPSNPLPESELEASFDGTPGRGRGSDQDTHEKQKCKGEGDSLTANPLSTAHHDSVKSERSEMSKGENSDMDGKSRLKKHLKTDIGNDGKDSSVDSDRLAARKRRFAESGGRTIRQKRSRHEEEDGIQPSDFGPSATYVKEADTDKHKDSQRRDSRPKTDKSGTLKDSQEDVRGQREKSEGSLDPLESKRHPGHTSSRRFSHEGITDQKDHVDIDLSQSYRKQMEQNRRLHQQQQQRESDKPDKPVSPQGSEMDDLEHRSLVHEVGKPPEDVTDNFPSHKLKKLEFDTDMGIKRERVYRSFRQKSEDPDWNNTASPGHQHFPHHVDEDFVDPCQKELSRNEEKIHPDLELLVKRTHNTQVNKQNTPVLSVEEEQQKRWESRVKQDLLPDLNFSRSLSKNIHNRKRLEYGIWHDLEPGEVRSDPEDDRETKPRSPMPSTSMPFSERPRVDRFSDPKLAHLERNKFYSFALDQTITPDTKALLERAKSLSSSREDNWSFLDYDSHFASLRNRKDTEKVEAAPRPTPSWYIVKKKIRSGSEDKLDDRKEEPKPEEPERRELFASRFLHSPVFELDSRRLQHLERKHEEPESTQNQPPGQQGTVDGEPDTGPVVLFHSRFMELMRLQQQKNKTHQLQEAKGDMVLMDENKVEKSPVQEQPALQSSETTESTMEPEIKPISPAETLISEPQLTPASVPQSVVKDIPPPEDKCVALNLAPDPYPSGSVIKEEAKDDAKENEPVAPVHHPQTETSPDSQNAPIVVPEPSYSVDRCNLSPSKGRLEIVAEDVKPCSTEKPCRRDSHDLAEEVDFVKKESHSTSRTIAEPEGEKKPQVSKGQIPSDNDTIDEPISPQKEHKTKEMKNKKGKQSPAQTAPVPVMSASGSEKQATRKSERIDKEKLKRGSSPRADLKSTGKSPIHGSDPDTLEQSIPLGRARRRNVKSVYATPVEDDAPIRPGKEMTESPRSARKRATDKDATQQQNIEQDPPAPAPAPITKRGRPPKNRRQGDESSTAKVEKSKIDNKDTDSNESESGERIPRVSKGKTSPHGTKSSLNQMSTVLGSGSAKKGEKPEATEDDDQDMDFTDEDPLALQDSSSSCKEDPLVKLGNQEDSTKKSAISDVISQELELESDPDEEKPPYPASETELMAAIDSITAGEATVSLPQAPPPSADVGSESEMQDFIQPAKEEEPETNTPAAQEESVFPTTPKRGTKGRPKTPKRPKAQKQAKKDVKEENVISEELTTPLTDSTASSEKTIPETTPSSATAAVITPTTWKSEPEPSAVKDKEMNAESSEEQVQHFKSVIPQSKSPICPKPQQVPSECISPSLSPLSNRPNIRPTPPIIRNPVSPPDWRHQSKDAAVCSSPVMPLASKENQPLPSDSENTVIDHGTSDLRQILMKHKNISLPGSSPIPGNLLTLRDQNPSESNTPSAVVPNKSPLSDGRMPVHSVPSVVRPPASLTSPETKSVISVIASTATSVISRVCNPPEPEDKVNMNIANPCVDMALPKPTYRPSKDDTGSYHGQSVGDEVGSAARFIVESPTLGTGSCPGLRVNTSEGVVVLSHSGQKTEGPQRISAKISQIPQATAGDMESQQLVSMPQIKQEMYGHSHSALQKGPSSQTDHGHPGKMQSTLSSIKQEGTGLEKMESVYQSGPQGVVKRLTQGNQQVMSYHQEFMPIKHQKKMDSVDSDGAKPSWTSAISPAISPHLPSPPGNHVGFVTTAGDRAPSHISGIKQEPRSPRKSGHPHSPFTKVSSPIGSSSPKGIPVMLPSGLPAMQQFITGVHHPEQSVIMPPHSVPGGLGRMSPHRVSQSIPVGHLVQGDVRVNTPPLSVMSYGMHSESLASPWSGPMQPRPTSPQAVGRDKVLKVNPSSLRSLEQEQEETRRFHQATGRQAATQLKPDTMQSDPRGPLRNSVQLETYMTQNMRVLLHQQGDRLATDAHSGHIQDTLPPSSAPSSLPLSLSPRPHVLSKGVSEKDMTKPLEAKRPHSPLPKDGMMAIRQSGQAMASPQRVQLLTPGPSGSFPEYSGMYSNPRGTHSQMPEMSSVGLNQPPLSVTPTMVILQEIQSSFRLQYGKMTQPVNMVQLLMKYPIVWQGLLALKNDTAAVQLHFVCGNKALAHRSLPLQEGGALLRIVQRMRLEASQLESVARRMTGDTDFCLLLALPCGRDQDDVLNQTQALKAAFINYLQAKLAAGIINIPNPGSNQPAYVLQIFPPCEFSESHLSQLAPDLLNRISSISPHLMIVITSV